MKNTLNVSKIRIIGIIALAAIIGFTVIACGGGSGGGGKLSGTYASDDGSMVYTFSGKKVTAEAFGQKGEATYELKDGNFNMIMDGKTESYPYKLEGNKFTFDWYGMEIVLTKK